MTLIPGIYNFCDRWCERCAFNNRCRVFKRTQGFELGNGGLNTENVWEQIRDNFDQAELLLNKAAEKFGINLDQLTEEDDGEYERRQEAIDKQVKENALIILCNEYVEAATGLLEDKNVIEEKTEGLIREFKLGLTNKEEASDIAIDVSACLDVILWYKHFIYVKFIRALTGKWEDLYDEPVDYPKDSDGTAKIALIAVDRSLEGWYRLYQLIPGYEDRILTILALLGKIKTYGELEFPDARKFIRPGFDEEGIGGLAD